MRSFNSCSSALPPTYRECNISHMTVVDQMYARALATRSTNWPEAGSCLNATATREDWMRERRIQSRAMDHALLAFCTHVSS